MKNNNVANIRSIPKEASLLIRLLNEGNEEGLVAIYRLYNKQMLFFAQKYVKNHQIAEEIVADVFVSLWERRQSFSTIDRVRAFLYIATKNRCLNQLRNAKSYECIEGIDEAREHLYDDADAFTRIVRTELMKTIYDEVKKLPGKQQEVFSKTFFEDKSVEEIAAEMNMASQAVYTNKSRALNSLKHRLQWIEAFILVLSVLLHKIF